MMDNAFYTIPRWLKLYSLLSLFFCIIVILSNIIACKLFKAPFDHRLALSAGMLTYPLTFLVGDLVTELFGEHKARLMVYNGLAMGFIAHLVVLSAVALPAHPATDQRAFEWVFGLNGLAIYTSSAAYAIGQILDIKIFYSLKKLTQGRHLWFRNNASTLISQLIDTFLVNTVFFYFGFHFEPIAIAKIIAISYLYKSLISVLTTPLFYLAVKLSKKYIYEHSPVLA